MKILEHIKKHKEIKEIELKVLKSFWTIFVTYLMISTSVPITFAQTTLKTCHDVRASEVIYCSMPLEMVNKEYFTCCGDGITFGWETGSECSQGTYNDYDASYCRENEDELIDNYETCRRKCASNGYTEWDYEYSSKSCVCQIPQEVDDYQYFFYVDKNSNDNIELQIKDVSPMKQYISLERLLPGGVSADTDKETIHISDSTSFIIHGNGKEMKIKKSDSFVEPINIIPIKECDQLVASMLHSQLKLVDGYAEENYDVTGTYIGFEGRLANGIYQEALRPDITEPGIFEVGNRIEVVRVKRDGANGLKFETSGSYGNFDNAITALNEPWPKEVESLAYFASKQGTDKTAMILDLNDIVDQFENRVNLPSNPDAQKIFEWLDNNGLVYYGDYLHTHPGGDFKLSRPDVIGFGRKVAHADYPYVHGKLVVLDPDTGNYKMYLLNIDEARWEYHKFNLEFTRLSNEGYTGDALEREVQRYLNNYASENAYSYELSVGKNPASETVDAIVTITRVDDLLKTSNELYKELDSILYDVSKLRTNVEIKYQRFGEITGSEWDEIIEEFLEYKKTVIDVKARTNALSKVTDSDLVQRKISYIQGTAQGIEYHLDAISIKNSGSANDLKLPINLLDEIESNKLSFEKSLYENILENQKTLPALVEELNYRGFNIDDRPEFYQSVRESVDDLRKVADDVRPFYGQDTIIKPKESLNNAKNSAWLGKFVEVSSTVGDILATAGVVTSGYGEYIDDANVMFMGKTITLAGVGLETTVVGITIATLMSSAVGVATISATDIFTGFITGSIEGILIGLVIVAVANFIICWQHPDSPYCRCSVNPYYGDNPILELEETTIRRGDTINYIIYGMQYCHPGDFFGNPYYLFNLFASKEGLFTNFVGEPVITCNFEDSMCCEGSTKFDVDSGQYDIFGWLTWNPQSGAIATTEEYTLTIGEGVDDDGDGSELMSSISVKSGWNSISAPYNTVTFDTSSCILFSNAFHWASNDYETINIGNMEGGVGYWVYSYNDCEIDLSAYLDPINAPTTSELDDGWNQIAVPLEGLEKSEIQCVRIDGPKIWNPETSVWDNIESMVSGKSYFIKCDA